MGKGIRFAVLACAATVGALALPSFASAAVTCGLNAGTLTIEIQAGSQTASIERGTGAASDEIIVRDGVVGVGAPVGCGTTPTVLNTDTIDLTESVLGQSSSLQISLPNGAFAPGATDEGDGSSEIEITAGFEPGGSDLIQFRATSGPENLRFGSDAAATLVGNLNGAEATGPDTDLTATNVERILAIGLGGGDDVVTGDGSAVPDATGPTGAEMRMEGQAGDDVLTTGSAAFGNSADGGPDNDTLTGGVADDSLNPDSGDDVVDGNGGSGDLVSYLNQPGPVTLDLGVSAPQDTGGEGTDTISDVEGFVGSNGDDVVTGTNGPNTLVGGQSTNDIGDDVFFGLGGNDTLRGDGGDDVLAGGADNDSFSGGNGIDTISYAASPAGVTFSLATALNVGQATGGSGTDTLVDAPVPADVAHRIENIVGSSFDDSLTGDAEANSLDGDLGIDLLELGGNDDTFDAHDGGIDTVDCGPGNDSGIADELNPAPVDAVNANCETTDFAPQTSVVAGPADGGTTTSTTPLYTLSSDEVGASFEYSVDGGAFLPCAASCAVGPLALGAHTIDFRAVNSLVDLVPATRALTVVPPPTSTPPPGTTTPTEPSTTKKKCKRKKGKGGKKKKKCKRKKRR